MSDDSEPVDPPAALTPSEIAILMLCEQFNGTKRAIDTWTMLALVHDVPLAKIQAAGAIAEQLQAWCQQYGPWDPQRPPRSDR